MRKRSLIALTVTMVLFSSLTSYADQWKQDSKGYVLANTMTPDGYKIGSDGAWLNGSEAQSQGISESQKEIIEDSLEIFLNYKKWESDKYIHIPVYTSTLTDDDIVVLLYNHLVSDAANTNLGKGSTFPLIGKSGDGYGYSFNYDQSKKMIKDLYGHNVNDNIVEEIINVSGNIITCYPGDAGEWTYLTIGDWQISDEELLVYLDYKTIVYENGRVGSKGRLGAKYKKNADSFFGYTLLSVWNDNLGIG